MTEQMIGGLDDVQYFDVRLYLTKLYEKNFQENRLHEKYQVLGAFINFC